MLHSSRSRKQTRPRLQRLEDRTVAATLIWTGALDNFWGTNTLGMTNWNTNTLPASGDDLIFPASGANHTNTNNRSNLALNSITFTGTNYAIGGNAITLTSLADTSTAGANALNMPNTLTTSLSASVTVASTRLTLSGAITGAGGLTKTGSGILRLSGVAINTYNGLTTVSAGSLELAKTNQATAVPGDVTINGGAVHDLANNQIDDTATVTVNAGGAFDLNNLADTIFALTIVGGSVTIGTGDLVAGPVTMTGGSIASTGAGELGLRGDVTTNASSAVATISGHLNLRGVTRSFTVFHGAAIPDLDVSAVVTNGALAKLGNGVFRLSGSGSNTYVGLTQVLAGTLEMVKNASAVAVPGDLTITGGTAREVVGNQIADTSTVSVNASTTFDLDGGLDTIGPLQVNVGSVLIGSGQLSVNGGLTMTGGSFDFGTGLLVLGSDVVINANSSSAVIGVNLDLGGMTRTFTVADGAAISDLEIAGIIQNGGLTKAGSGTLRMDGVAANTYTGATIVSNGTLDLDGSNSIAAVAGNLTINGGSVRETISGQIADTSSVTVNAGGTLDLNGKTDTIGGLTVTGGSVTIGMGTLTAGPVFMTGGSISSTGAGMLVLQGNLTTNAASGTATISGNLNLGGATRPFTVADGAPGVDADLLGVVQNGGLTKAGAGTLRLSGSSANGYTGLTTVSAGTLLLAKNSGIECVPGNLTINGGIVREAGNNEVSNAATVTVNTGGTFDLNGQSDTVGPVTVTGATLNTSGSPLGRLTAGSTSFNSTATLMMKLVDAVTSDRLTINGTVAIGGNLQLSAQSAIAIGSAIILIDNDGTDAVTGTFLNLPQGATFLAGGQLFAISYTGGSGNDVVVTRTGGPTVLSTQVNDGSAQRSRVTSLTMTFSAPLNFVSPAFTLTRTGGGAVTFGSSFSVVNGVSVVTLQNFTGNETEFGSLKDGRYTLTAIASQITFNGLQLDGNGDGTPGDNYTFGDQQGLFRFYGDINGDRHVDIADFGLFATSYGLHTGQSGFNAAFDFNNDGIIDIADFGQFAIRIFTVLP